jgi:hypothetical protein
MSSTEMVRVFIKRAIAVGGLPFDMRVPYNDKLGSGRLMPIFGQPPQLLAEVARDAARAAAAGQRAAGRHYDHPPTENLEPIDASRAR